MSEAVAVSDAGAPSRARRRVPPEVGVFLALVAITLIFELLNRLNGGSFLFNMRDNVDALFNEQRLQIIILQVSITGIIAIGVTQVIILGGIDLSSGSIVGATAMIAMSFAQTAIVNGNPEPEGDLRRRLHGPAGHRAARGRPRLRAARRPDQRPPHRLHAHPALHRHPRHDGFRARRRPLVVERRSDLLPDDELRLALERRFPGLGRPSD